jgi:hypothetical protein
VIGWHKMLYRVFWFDEQIIGILTTKLTGGYGAQRNRRPVQRLVIRYIKHLKLLF